MNRSLLLACLPAFLILAALLLGDDAQRGRYRKHAGRKTLDRWHRDHATKKALVPAPPAPPDSAAEAVDFSGTFRFGPYGYDLAVRQKGDQVTFRSGGVDRQDIGGAFETVGAGFVRDGRVYARWWCFDLSRNYANTGGAELWFTDPARNRLHVRYYHDADERMEEGYGVRTGKYKRQKLHYRIRLEHTTRQYENGLVLRGTVRGRGGAPLRDAVVMLRHEEQTAVRTDAAGRWSIRVSRLPMVQMVAAAAPGYRSSVQAILSHEVRPLDFVLEESPWSDDPRYQFVEPTRSKGREIFRCGNCHRNSYDEWIKSRHFYTASNVITKAVFLRDFLPALAAGKAQGDAGLCAACHAPQAALDSRRVRLDAVEGVARFGNHCDFCHKVHHTEDIEAPGVRGSLRLGRPSPGDASVPGPIQRVYGGPADSDYLFMGSVYNPFFGTSALCAGCHQYTTPAGIAALNTYTEWRGWAAGQSSHQSCQTCHMRTGTSREGKKLAKRICINALRRPKEQIHNHSFSGRELAREAVKLKARARIEGRRLVVTTTLSLRDVGHRVPTGSADKHLLLVVLAADGAGKPYPLRAGKRVPSHAGGAGDPTKLDATALRERLEKADYGGMPGREFAQVLADREGHTHVPFWRAARQVDDTRLEPGRPVTLDHVFDLPADGPVQVRVELWHRLRFKAHDVAADVTGPGVRPLDFRVARRSLDVR